MLMLRPAYAALLIFAEGCEAVPDLTFVGPEAGPFDGGADGGEATRGTRGTERLFPATTPVRQVQCAAARRCASIESRSNPATAGTVLG
jgi:hypothetical protein